LSKKSSGGATRPLPRDGVSEEFLRDPTLGPGLKVGPEIKDGSPEMLRCRTIQKEVS